MTDVSPFPRSNGLLVVCVVVVVVIAGCEAQPISARVKETRMKNLSAVDFMRVCLATVVPRQFSLVSTQYRSKIVCENGTISFRFWNRRV
jgi:Ca2+/H+ antiporter